MHYERARTAGSVPVAQCSFPGCSNTSKALGLCSGHYTQQADGRELVPLQRELSLAERLRIICPEGDPNDCWLWPQDRLTRYGYGRIAYNGDELRAHRAAWEVANGPIPDGLIVRHKCDVRHCTNPSHLELGDHQDNMTDMRVRDRAAKGTDNGVAILNEDIVRRIREMYAGGWGQTAIGREFGISQPHVSQIVKRQIWRHVED